MAGRRWFAVLVVAAALAGTLVYLRDPPWLADLTSGMHPWITDEDGRRVRWIDGRASFFVPSDARGLKVPIRTTFDDPAEWPIRVTVTLDGRPVERLTLTDPAWRVIEFRLPPPGSRRHRRVDIHLDRLRGDGRGALIGEIELRR